MSKNTRKCPNCGAIMGINVKYCRKCRTKMDSGRVEVLPTPAERSSSRVQDDDALRNLPKPVRPAEDTARPVDGFFAPETAEEVEAEPSRPQRTGSTPRPTSTARTAADLERADYSGSSNKQKKVWQMAAVLGVIAVIVAVAVVLVIKLNAPGDSVETSQPYENEPPVGSVETPSPSPEPTEEPVVTAKPEAVLPPVANDQPGATPIPAQATATPEPTANPGYTVTEANDTVYITGGAVNIRSGPGTDYNAVGSENAGYELHRTGRTSNGWSRVQYSGGEAYVSETYLSTEKPAATAAPSYSVTDASGTVKVRTASNLRSGPGTGYGVITTVSAGTELTRTGTSGGWTRVSYNNQTAFISTDLLESDSTSSSSDETLSGTVTITGNGVRVRSGPGTNYNQIGSVNSGTSLTVTGKEGNWYKVTYNGQTGYVSADYAKKD